MKIPRLSLKAATVLVLFVVLTVASIALVLAKPRPGPGPCNKNLVCPDVVLPVICADGITYVNQCYADRVCAPGPCVRTGDAVADLR